MYYTYKLTTLGATLKLINKLIRICLFLFHKIEHKGGYLGLSIMFFSSLRQIFLTAHIFYSFHKTLYCLFYKLCIFFCLAKAV